MSNSMTVELEKPENAPAAEGQSVPSVEVAEISSSESRTEAGSRRNQLSGFGNSSPGGTVTQLETDPRNTNRQESDVSVGYFFPSIDDGLNVGAEAVRSKINREPIPSSI